MFKRVKTRLFTVAVMMLCLNRAGLSQGSRVGTECDLAVVGGRDANEFLAFDRDLRQAVKTGNQGAIALLVGYPLAVNDGRGTYRIKDSASLQGRFEEIFTPVVRKAITEQPLNDIACLPEGVMYGRGLVWVNLTRAGYAVTAITVPQSSQHTPRTAGRIEFVCRTDELRALVDLAPGGKPRYRAWRKTQSLMEKPYVEIANGTATSEGTGPCRHEIWSFTGAGKELTVEELGCYERASEPPPNATGQLVISTGGKSEKTWWCY